MFDHHSVSGAKMVHQSHGGELLLDGFLKRVRQVKPGDRPSVVTGQL
jgi:hypothetical protein